MICNDCRRENRPDARFCASCGSALARACQACGRDLAADASFCDGCGQPTKSGTVPLLPRAYTPKHLAEKILTSKSALEGERKQVTVLFADIKGSLDIAEELDPEEWHRVLNRFFAIMASGIHRFEGTINQYTGDGIMALFGAPITHEDHAQRACYAALQLTADLRGFTQELKRQTGVNLSVRMGINSGEVVVGKIGDDLRMDYTAQGHTVGLAARMEQLAEPGKTYLSRDTQALVAGYFELEDLGEFAVKGSSAPVRVFELKGAGALRTRLDVSRARGFTRFVGRREEMAALELAMSHALEGKGQVIGVVGEAGVGKSRLCAEFVEACRARGYTINAAHCVAHGKAIPFLPVLELFRDYMGVDETEDDKAAREKIAGKLLLLDEAFREGLPLVFDFLGVADPARPAPRIDPEAREKRLFAMIKRIMQAESERDPGAILVEDLHWIDGGSEAFLEALVEMVPATRTLLVLNYRPDYRAPWMRRSYYQQLSLRPLGPEEIAEMARDLFGSDPSLEGIPARIMARTGGNPFFIEEVIQSLAESGILEGSRGSYRLAGRLEDASIPANVQAILGARIDRLAEREKHVLQTASVIGKEFSRSLLQRVGDLPEQDLASALHNLTAAEFIYEKAIYPESIQTFKHPLTQEVAYHSQLSEKRTAMHEAIARTIEETQSKNLDEQAALMAHHWGEAGNALTAALWNMRAAQWATARNLREADRHWHAVLDLLKSLPESGETTDLRILASAKILGVAWRVGITDDEASRIYEEGRTLAERAGNLAGLAAVKNSYGTVCGLMGRLEEYKRLSREGLEAARQAKDALLVFGISLDVIYSSFETGEPAFALSVADAALAGDPKHLGPQGRALWGIDTYMLAHNFRGAVLQELGRLEEGRASLEKSLRLAREAKARDAAGLALGWLSSFGDFKGDFRAAMEYAQQWIAIAEEVGAPLDRAVSYMLLAVARVRLEDWMGAREAAERSLEIARTSGSVVVFQPFALAALAESLAGLGEKAEAVARAEEALSMARAQGGKRGECQALISLARVLLANEGAAAEARIRETLDAGIAVAKECGYKARIPYMLFERANLAALKSERASQRRDLEEARRLWQEMGATKNVERATEALRAP